MFHGAETFSVLELLFNYWPDGLYGGTIAIRGLMNTGIWSTIFNDLAVHPAHTQVDFRCGMNKDFLKEGGLKEHQVSKVQFRNENIISFDFHFGCSIYSYEKRNADLSTMELIGEFF